MYFKVQVRFQSITFFIYTDYLIKSILILKPEIKVNICQSNITSPHQSNIGGAKIAM